MKRSAKNFALEIGIIHANFLMGGLVKKNTAADGI